MEGRGPGYLNQELTVFDAATSYLMGLASWREEKIQRCHFYFGECLSILRCRGIFASGASATTGDHISQEVGRRIFWLLFMSTKKLQQLHMIPDALIPVGVWSHQPYKGNPCEMPNPAKCRIFNFCSYTQELSLHNNHIDLYDKN